VPQIPQYFSPGSIGLPQFAQPAATGDPHSTQNRRPALLSVPQLGQITYGCSDTTLVG
jgi:hypothetical protein